MVFAAVGARAEDKPKPTEPRKATLTGVVSVTVNEEKAVTALKFTAKTERGEKTVFGKALRAKRDMVLGDYRIMAADDYKTTAQYCLAQAHTDPQETL